MIEAPKGRSRRALPAIVAVALIGSAAVGAALGPAAAQQARTLGAIVNSVITCHSASACAGGINTGTGFGVLAVSAATNGVDSATKNPSSTTHHGRSGVYGHDDSTDLGTLNVGVAGSSNLGTGMQASSTNGIGLQATGGQIGISASSGFGDAIDASSTGTGNAAAVLAMATNSAAVYAISTANIGVAAVAGAGNTSPGLAVAGGTADQSGKLIAGTDRNGTPIFTVDNAGNEHITGQVFTQGSCSLGCSRTRRVTSYAARESVPSIEDIGEGQLAAGKARIMLDPAFANVIDKDAPYAVFVSPDGSSHGLFVTQKGATGFTVLENFGGRATIPFSYRIVAKPYGVTLARLPMTDSPTTPSRRQMPHLPTTHSH
jgi:hypothetical protein